MSFIVEFWDCRCENVMKYLSFTVSCVWTFEVDIKGGRGHFAIYMMVLTVVNIIEVLYTERNLFLDLVELDHGWFVIALLRLVCNYANQSRK